VGLNVRAESVPKLRDGYAQEVLTDLDLQSSGIGTIIWATGYNFDFSLVKVPLVDTDGYPIQKRGVTDYDGLYFLGMPWLHSRRSGILFGVGDDAAYIAQHIGARRIPAGFLSKTWQGRAAQG
jgi:putative flavoprotein involved in K+ transport